MSTPLPPRPPSDRRLDKGEGLKGPQHARPTHQVLGMLYITQLAELSFDHFLVEVTAD